MRRCCRARAHSPSSWCASPRRRSPRRAACCAGTRRALLERIEAEARIFSAQLKSQEFRAAVSAFLARAKGK